MSSTILEFLRLTVLLNTLHSLDHSSKAENYISYLDKKHNIKSIGKCQYLISDFPLKVFLLAINEQNQKMPKADLAKRMPA